MKSKINVFLFKPQIKNIYLIGIGGIGMSGIAKLLFQDGYIVKGSDLVQNEMTNYLMNLGIKINFNHDSNDIIKSDLIIKSAAIKDNNKEIIKATIYKIPIISRTEMLNELIRFKYGILVLGTHGKTTTTSMIIDIFLKASLNLSYINGGITKDINLHANLGSDFKFISEIDESDKLFLKLNPIVSVLTNIDDDHLNEYNGSLKELKKYFINFINKIPFYGYSVICIDDFITKSIIKKINTKIITYGFSKESDFQILNYKQSINGSSFFVKRNNKSGLNVNIKIPGKHNAINATAAIAIATKEKINDKIILNSLKNFKNIRKRFEIIGKFYFKFKNKNGELILINDYGHHPTEIDVTIKTIKSILFNRRIIMFFQPHKYTRTQILYNKFIKVLLKIDILLIYNIYSAGEKHIEKINSLSINNDINNYNKTISILIKNYEDLVNKLMNIIKNKDIILIQGAGNIDLLIYNLIKSNLIFKKYK